MIKIAFIGAGSYGFTVKLVADILSFDELRDSELTFMDVDPKRMERVKTIVNAYLKKEGYPQKPLYTRSRKKALEGANFIVNLVKVGFLEASIQDMDVPKKFGLKQTIGDTSGIGGVFRGLRTMPFNIQLCKEIEEVSAPGALVLNYTNPQGMLIMASAATSKVPIIGLCHSVQGTSRLVARYLDVPFDEFAFEGAGINHMCWLTKFEHNNKDLYPRLRRLVKQRGIYNQMSGKKDLGPFLGTTRLDMLNRTGYVVTESSNHFAEYVPFYLRTEELIERYDLKIDQYRNNISGKEKRYDGMYRQAKKGKLPEFNRSFEYGSQIIHSMVTDEPCRIYGNVMNNGLVTNLPEFSCVEVACLVDRNGIHPCHFGELPTAVAAMCRMEIHVHQLAVEAILNKSRRSVYHALMMDPLTHSKLTIDEIEEVVDTLVEKQRTYLGKHLGRKN